MAKVSILLPTYNGAKYVSKAVDSVLAQSYQDWELIVIDDASADNIIDIIKDYAGKDKRISFEQNKKNLGLPGNLNKGILMSSGEYIARIDQDDAWIDEGKLEKQVKFLDNHPDFVLIGTGYRIVDSRGAHIRDVAPIADDRSIRKNILSFNPFGHATVVFRKDPAIKIGGYNPNIRYGEDYDLWLRLGRKGMMANIPEISMQYLVSDGMSNKHNRWKQAKFHMGLLFKYGMNYPGLLRAIVRLSAHSVKWVFARYLK
jgi:glycosyltransferase involved in cell wall biosynthesis